MIKLVTSKWNSIKLWMVKMLGVPKHIAFIMDGNRRWSSQHRLPTAQGHSSGLSSMETMMQVCCDLGVSHMTVYAFSEDNFARTSDEVSAIMELAIKAIEKLIQQREVLERNQIRISLFGDLDIMLSRLPDKTQATTIRHNAVELMEATKGYSRFFFNVCFAYSSEHEIHKSAQRLAYATKHNLIRPTDITFDHVLESLDSYSQPPVDLLVRTSGETRLSDFLLLQTGTAVLHFTSEYWPDYSPNLLYRAIAVWRRARHHQAVVRKMLSDELADAGRVPSRPDSSLPDPSPKTVAAFTDRMQVLGRKWQLEHNEPVPWATIADEAASQLKTK